jgi:hypothetical protein
VRDGVHRDLGGVRHFRQLPGLKDYGLSALLMGCSRVDKDRAGKALVAVRYWPQRCKSGALLSWGWDRTCENWSTTRECRFSGGKYCVVPCCAGRATAVHHMRVRYGSTGVLAVLLLYVMGFDTPEGKKRGRVSRGACMCAPLPPFEVFCITTPAGLQQDTARRSSLRTMGTAAAKPGTLDATTRSRSCPASGPRYIPCWCGRSLQGRGSQLRTCGPKQKVVAPTCKDAPQGPHVHRGGVAGAPEQQLRCPVPPRKHLRHHRCTCCCRQLPTRVLGADYLSAGNCPPACCLL